MTEPTKPLAGLKVVELGTLIAGPFCTRIMGEFGAEVIKVEAPDGGDPLRKWRKLYEGTSLWWYVQARNKKSVTANLKHPEGREFVRKLIAEADILVENFRPGVLEKLGLGWETLKADNPGLVMVRLSGFGQSGPYKDQPGFGAMGESMGGLRYVTGFADRPPVRTGISIGDSIAALWGAIGGLMALRHREVNGGAGQVVDVALYEAVFASVVAIRLQLAAQRVVAPTYAALAYTLEPVVAAVASLLLTGDRLSPVQWLGGACIVTGSLLPELRRRTFTRS